MVETIAKTHWSHLLTLCAGIMTLYMNTTMVAVALPALTNSLGASPAEAAWVVSAYNVAFLAVLLPCGLFGDRLGHKRLLLLGSMVFLVSALVCALAPSAIWLIVGRAGMGLAASVFTPMSLALLPTVIEPSDMALANSLWTAAGGVGAPLGPLLGGWIIHALGWRGIFWLDVVVIALVFFGCSRLPKARAVPSHPVLPWVQILLSAFGFLVLTVGMINVSGKVSFSAVWLPILIGLAALALALVFGGRSDQALVDLGLMNNPRFLVNTVTLFFINLVLFGLLYVTPHYLQNILGNSPARGGLMLMPLAGTAIVGALAAGLLVRRSKIGRWLLPSSIFLVAGGLLVGALTSPSSGYGYLAAGLSLAGFGVGAGQSLALQEAMAQVHPERRGSGASLVNTIRQLGSLLGVAFIASLVINLAGEPASDASYIHAMDSVFVLCSAACVLTGFALLFMHTRQQKL